MRTLWHNVRGEWPVIKVILVALMLATIATLTLHLTELRARLDLERRRADVNLAWFLRCLNGTPVGYVVEGNTRIYQVCKGVMEIPIKGPF